MHNNKPRKHGRTTIMHTNTGTRTKRNGAHMQKTAWQDVRVIRLQDQSVHKQGVAAREERKSLLNRLAHLAPHLLTQPVKMMSA